MDGDRFDRLSASFSAAATRRGLLSLLTVPPLVGALIASIDRESEAAGPRQRGNARRRGSDSRGQVRDERKKPKKKKKCARAGQTPRKGKRCCRGLVRGGAGQCTQPDGQGCAATCSGCCVGGTCVTSPSNAACGAGGAPCAVCTGLQACFNGACRCGDVCDNGCQFSSVQAAIDSATGVDTISICAGAFVEHLTIARDVTLVGAGDGPDPAGNTILRGTGSGRVVTIPENDQSVTLRRLRITGGAASGGDNGGGIDTRAALLTLEDCTITGNSAPNGGGIRTDGDATVMMSGCTISVNTAVGGNGGGILNGGRMMTLTECDVTGNSSGSQGGGLFNGKDDSTLTLHTSTVSGNTGSSGGGITNLGTLTLVNSDVTGNVVSEAGKAGGIENVETGDEVVTLTDGSTVTGNDDPQCTGTTAC